MGTYARGRTGPAGEDGKYARLASAYFEDDRIGEAGPLGEVLFIRSIAYCAGRLTDGFMSRQQVRRFVAVGLDDVDGLCQTLVDVGLWEVDEERYGFVIVNFLKWNRSKEEITYSRARDAQRKQRERQSVDARVSRTRTGIDGGTESARTRDGHGTESSAGPLHRPDQTRSVLLAGGQARTEPPVAAAPPEMKELREKLSRLTLAKKARGESPTTGEPG
jgi:hypothetical protein